MKLASQVEELTTKDRIRSLLNKFMRMVIQDEDRKKFEKDLPIMKVKSTIVEEPLTLLLKLIAVKTGPNSGALAPDFLQCEGPLLTEKRLF
jgi:hypothetical protein